MTSITGVSDRLAEAGYQAPRSVALAVAALLASRPIDGARALVLEGPPGAGKSALAQAVASVVGVALTPYQFHGWTDSDELFVGVDVVAAVAGDHENTRQLGVLARIAEASHAATPERPVVVLLDEIDKAPLRAEALLLDWLQTGRVPVAPGVHLHTALDSVVVLITTNAQRPLSDALLRRMRRLVVPPLTAKALTALAATQTGWSAKSVRTVLVFAREVALADGQALTLQEARNLLADLNLAESADDLREMVTGWAARGAPGRDLARTSPRAAAAWDAVLRHRRAP